jgi:hypothetical protein
LLLLKDCSVASLDLAGTQAASADAHLLDAAVDDDVHGLDIRRPAALGLAIGMADQIAGHGSFLADFTELTHSVHLLAKTRTLQYYHKVFNNASFIFSKSDFFSANLTIFQVCETFLGGTSAHSEKIVLPERLVDDDRDRVA